MSAALKTKIDSALVQKIFCGLRKAAGPQLPIAVPSRQRIQTQLRRLELKARIEFIAREIDFVLASEQRSAEIVARAARIEDLRGFAVWPLTHFIQLRYTKTKGLKDFPGVIEALAELTERFTAEFALRPMLIREPKATIEFLKRWARSDNYHLRRAASEGLRPRLPWGEQLGWAIKNPRPGLDVISQLRFDPEPYVWRSVANHLNDISRNHPDVVLSTLKKWSRSCPAQSRQQFSKMQAHALRTLLKRGNHQAFNLIGLQVEPTHIRIDDLSLKTPTVFINRDLLFSFSIGAGERLEKPICLRIDFILGFLRQGNRRIEKVFRLRNIVLRAAQKERVEGRFAVRTISTRRYYSGQQTLEILINGRRSSGPHIWTLRT